MSDDRPTICPPGEHVEVCHCGDDMDGHSLTGNHGPVSMGCPYCLRTPEELQAQEGAA